MTSVMANRVYWSTKQKAIHTFMNPFYYFLNKIRISWIIILKLRNGCYVHFLSFLIFQVEALNQKKTVAFINHFVTHTARFLNKFSNVCEEKLEHLDGRLKQLEISLNILEAKVSHIFICYCFLFFYTFKKKFTVNSYYIEVRKLTTILIFNSRAPASDTVGLVFKSWLKWSFRAIGS